MWRLLPLTVLAGCLYTDVVNSAPAAEIEDLAPAVHYKGDTVRLSARKSVDPDGDRLRYEWRALSCDDPMVCDPPFATGAERDFELAIPSKRLVIAALRVKDAHGAEQNATFPINAANRAPALRLQVRGQVNPTGTYVVGRELPIVAEGTDADTAPPDPDTLAYTWLLEPPPGEPIQPAAWTQISATEYRLRPWAVGTFAVTVTVADDDAANPLSATQTATLYVTEDQRPCIQATSPLAAAGAYVVERAAGPRRLSVESVSDELDPYPLPAGTSDPDLDSAHFRWFVDDVLVPGHDLHDLAVDPAAYAPGDVVKVRAEVTDRSLAWPTCPAGEDSCAAMLSTCAQRATWRLAVR